MRADFGQGAGLLGAERWVIDTLDHADPADSLDLYTTPESDIGTSSSGTNVRVTSPVTEDGPCVFVTQHQHLLNGYAGAGVPAACTPENTTFGSGAYLAHEGKGMLVHFGGDYGPARVRWSLVPEADEGGASVDLSAYTHLSLRIGNVVEDSSSCDPEYAPDEFTVVAELEDDDAMGQHLKDLGVQIESDRGGMTCSSANFAQTIRVPLARYCEDGQVSIGGARAILLHFEDPSESHIAIVDSLELVREPEGAAVVATCSEEPPPAPCPTVGNSDWNCVAKLSLDATETSCTDAPNPSTGCASPDVERNPVDVPEVSDSSGTFGGWVATIPRGWVHDPQSPTQAELDDIVDACVAACELEWSDQPDVDAECNATEFETPTLRHIAGERSRTAIPDTLADGSELFGGPALACDLRTSCCEAFDEHLCAARPGHRVTPASAPMGRGEEWKLVFEGSIQADSSHASAPAQAGVVGAIGYSFCKDGNDGIPCPFYVGSFELDLIEPLMLELECDTEPVIHELEALTATLVQPAFGMQQANTDKIAFPTGGLVFEADLLVDAVPFHSLASTEAPVFFDASTVAFSANGLADGFAIEFSLPCKGELADVQVWFELESTAIVDSPPAIDITLPGEIPCEDRVPLAASASDPDGDLVDVRWRIDGTLIAPGTSTIELTGSEHTFEAIARDARGATASDKHVVDCEP